MKSEQASASYAKLPPYMGSYEHLLRLLACMQSTVPRPSSSNRHHPGSWPTVQGIQCEDFPKCRKTLRQPANTTANPSTSGASPGSYFLHPTECEMLTSTISFTPVAPDPNPDPGERTSKKKLSKSYTVLRHTVATLQLYSFR